MWNSVWFGRNIQDCREVPPAIPYRINKDTEVVRAGRLAAPCSPVVAAISRSPKPDGIAQMEANYGMTHTSMQASTLRAGETPASAEAIDPALTHFCTRYACTQMHI